MIRWGGTQTRIKPRHKTTNEISYNNRIDINLIKDLLTTNIDYG